MNKLPKGYDLNANYCTCSLDGIFGYSWKIHCFYHDRQYRNEVRLRKTRKEVDIDLREGMKSELPKYLHFIPWIYYISVRLFNRRFWVK